MVSVLDHGYIRLVETWGSDQRVIESARMSTDGAFKGWGPRCATCGSGLLLQHPDRDPWCHNCSDRVRVRAGDERLLAYLWNHKHSTPFEMCGMTLEIQAPIFVFREWQRHRTQSYSELSARYTPMPDLYYIPTVERLLANRGETNKQAGTIAGAEQLDEAGATRFRETLMATCEKAQKDYRQALAAGVPKELARCLLPVNQYSRMRASANLRNWLAFLTLRMAPDAQWEIRQYADIVGSEVGAHFPRTWRLARADP